MKIAYRSLQIFVYAIIALLLFDLITLVAGCQKTAAQKPAAAVISCTDSAGIYFPTVISSNNAANISLTNQAHFIKVCDQVYVSGTMATGQNGIDTTLFSTVQISLPIPSNLGAVPAVNAAGQAMITQSGFPFHQPINGTVGLASVLNSGVTIRWKPESVHGFSVTYSFSYTIK